MKKLVQYFMRIVLAAIALFGALNILVEWVVDRNPGQTTVSTHTNYETYDGIPDTSVSINTATEFTSYSLMQLSVETAIIIALLFVVIIYFIFKDGFKAWSNSSISMILGGFTVTSGVGIYVWLSMQELVNGMNVGEFSPFVGVGCYLNLIISVIGFICIVIVKIVADKFDTSGKEKKGIIASIKESSENFQDFISKKF